MEITSQEETAITLVAAGQAGAQSAAAQALTETHTVEDLVTLREALVSARTHYPLADAGPIFPDTPTLMSVVESAGDPLAQDALAEPLSAEQQAGVRVRLSQLIVAAEAASVRVASAEVAAD